MKDTPFRMLAFVFAAVAALAFGSRAEAAFQMVIDDGVNPPITIVDDGVGDAEDTTAGLIRFSGATDGIAVNNIVGSSKPLTGDLTRAQLDISGLHLAGGAGGGTITITLSDTGFDLPFSGVGELLSSIGGTAGGSGTVMTETALDLANNQDYQGVPDLTIGPLSGLAFADIVSTGFPYAGETFSLHRQLTVVVNAQETISYNAFTRATIPEPATLAYVGLSLGVLGLRRRRRHVAVC